MSLSLRRLYSDVNHSPEGPDASIPLIERHGVVGKREGCASHCQSWAGPACRSIAPLVAYVVPARSKQHGSLKSLTGCWGFEASRSAGPPITLRLGSVTRTHPLPSPRAFCCCWAENLEHFSHGPAVIPLPTFRAGLI